MITRREALKQTALAGAAIAAFSSIPQLHAQTVGAAGGPFKLPPLPYSVDALEPYIDARTMELHHNKHHAAYVNNLNKAIAEAPGATGKSIEEILTNLDALPEKIRLTVRNNGGGHFNHSLFWQMMEKNGGGQPPAELSKAMDAAFGNFAGFKDKFVETATKVFGSGWAWLTVANGQLKIESQPNQDAPLGGGRLPILGLDVWEHAYYLQYQNRRADYIAAWFNVINWDFAAERFAKSKR